jgi:hypothetical protein
MTATPDDPDSHPYAAVTTGALKTMSNALAMSALTQLGRRKLRARMVPFPCGEDDE